MGMDQLLGSVQQSNESSNKFVNDTLAAVHDEIKSIKDKQTVQNDQKAVPPPVQYVKLPDNVAIPAVPSRERKRPHFIPSTANEQRSVKSKEDLSVHHRFMVISFGFISYLAHG